MAHPCLQIVAPDRLPGQQSHGHEKVGSTNSRIPGCATAPMPQLCTRAAYQASLDHVRHANFPPIGSSRLCQVSTASQGCARCRQHLKAAPGVDSISRLCQVSTASHVLQIKHRRLVRGDRAVPPAYDQLVAQRSALYKQLQDLQAQGGTTWKLEVPEELLSPRSRLAANAARRLAQGVSKGVHNLGTLLGDFGSFLASKQFVLIRHAKCESFDLIRYPGNCSCDVLRNAELPACVL